MTANKDVQKQKKDLENALLLVCDNIHTLEHRLKKAEKGELRVYSVWNSDNSDAALDRDSIWFAQRRLDAECERYEKLREELARLSSTCSQ